MAFKKGISGNPGGKSKDKIYSDALRVEVNRIDPNNPNRRKINALAEKLVSCALAGEGWAFKEIGDRLEGKAVQPLEHQEDWLILRDGKYKITPEGQRATEPFYRA
jgi:Family of unknown function (DUF5681)